MMIEGRCLCGSNVIAMSGEPAACAYCHCASCRDLYGGSFLAATAWLPEQLSFLEKNVSSFSHPSKSLARCYCTTCGEILFGTNRLGMRVVPNQMIARTQEGVFPAALLPRMHIFYGQRIVNIDDDLVKYVEGWDGPCVE